LIPSWVTSAASILKVVEDKPISEIDDQTLIMADLSRKAIQQVQRFVRTLLKDAIPQPKIQPDKIESIVEALTTDRSPMTIQSRLRKQQKWAANHRAPIDLQTNGVLPQPRGGRPSGIPMPYNDRFTSSQGKAITGSG